MQVFRLCEWTTHVYFNGEFTGIYFQGIANSEIMATCINLGVSKKERAIVCQKIIFYMVPVVKEFLNSKKES